MANKSIIPTQNKATTSPPDNLGNFIMLYFNWLI